ncbi:MAG: hypothetical protein ACYC8T_30840 [Myxococcaceae bacterium]
MRTRLSVALVLVAAQALSGCACGGGVSEGSCEGTIAGVDVSGPLDSDSRYHTEWAEAGVREESLTVLELSCGKGRLRVLATAHRIVALSRGSQPLPTSRCAQDGTPIHELPDAGASDGGSTDGGPGDAGTDAGAAPIVPEAGHTCGASGSTVHEWTLIEPSLAPRLAAGSLDAVLELLGSRIGGELAMEFADGSSVRVTFKLPHDTAADLGKMPESSGSGGSGHDWD